MMTFSDLHHIDISAIPIEGWQNYYDTMAPWLIADDPSIRKAAVERLTMAVFRAEPSVVSRAYLRDAAGNSHLVARMEWLLNAVSKAQATHKNVVPEFLRAIRYHGDDAPFNVPLANWLAAIEAFPPAGVDPCRALGARVLIQPVATWAEAVAWLLPMLDHPATYPRACAAYRLSNLADQDAFDEDLMGDVSHLPTEADIVALIVEKELARPGVLGPFWSPRYYSPYQIETTLWLIDILERRNGPAPADLPFNDIDFYLHELCGNNPVLIQRFIDNGFEELAWLAATEHAVPVEGMEPILRQLMQSTNARIAGSSARHLANQYGPDAPRSQVSHPAP
jgi:hypothetical protein